MKRIESRRVGDCYYRADHPSGLTVYLYPKEGFQSTCAILGTKYGSIDNCFQRSDEAKPETVPEGVAHFLEHKLFESREGDAFERFSQTGASANAYTSFQSTAYYFSCTDRLEDSLAILLDFVQTPYFTEETIRKELGIIGQEIQMYEDDPQWRVMFNYLRAMYRSHPVRQDIAGTVESIARITPEHLYRCYETFYNPRNMVLVLAGALDPDRVLEVCDRTMRPVKPVEVRRIFPPEPEQVCRGLCEEKLSVAMPLFQFGYKVPAGDRSPSERDEAAMEVLLEAMASDASPLFQRLLERGLINESSFGYETFEGPGFATILFGGESRDPKAVAKAIQEEADRFAQHGIPEEAFEAARRTLYGGAIAGLNRPTGIANSLLSLVCRGQELFPYLDALAELRAEDCAKKLDLFREDRSVLSIISPLETAERKDDT